MTYKIQNKRVILTETKVQNAVIKHLDERGWNKSLESKELWEKGVDIRVRNENYGRFWLIEVKGDPSRRVKSPAGSRSSSFNSAIGQIVTRMHNERAIKYSSCENGSKHGIAFSTYFRSMVIKKCHIG